MQYINLNKTIELQNKIEELLLISIDEQIDTIDDKEGVRVTGKIIVGGTAKTVEGNKEFSDYIDLDIFLIYEEITERNSLNVLVNDFNYKIKDNQLYLDISLKIDGLKEIEASFLAKEDNEFISEEEIMDKKVYIDEEIDIENKKEEIRETEAEVISNTEEVKEKFQSYNEEIENNICEETEADLIDDNNDREINKGDDLKNNTNEVVEEEKKSLLKSVFSNKRIKEEVSWRLHCVKDETTYEQIATKYGINLQKLISINNNEKLAEGKLIFLPLE